MKKFFIDLLLYILIFLIIGITESLFVWLTGKFFTWGRTEQICAIVLGTPAWFTTLQLPAWGIALLPLKTKFWLVMVELMLLVEIIFCPVHIWTDWWCMYEGTMANIIKGYATLILVALFVTSGIVTWGTFKERKEKENKN